VNQVCVLEHGCSFVVVISCSGKDASPLFRPRCSAAGETARRGAGQRREGDHPAEALRRDGPEQFLKGYAGYLQADALAQYEGLFATGEIIHVACNAHARRRFAAAGSPLATAPSAEPAFT
jgi:hypothetical protein